jgi:2-iminobutanoate/2-iminopropanoate deaminase
MRGLLILGLIPTLGLAGYGAAWRDTEAAGRSDGPRLGHAVAEELGDLVYVSGVMGVVPGSTDLAVGIEGQVRQTLENVRKALEMQGLDLSDVVRSNVFLADTRLFPEMNAVYRTFFAEDPPTRATVQSDLPRPDALVMVSMVAARRGVEKRVVTPVGLKTPELPYSWGIQVGRTLFVAGATSRDPETYQPVGGDIGGQTRQVLENVGAVLRGAGMSHRDVVSCMVFLDDARDFGEMNRVYATFFPDDPPARATVRAALMNSVFDVEIQCIAVADAPKEVVIADGARRSSAPYSPGIRVGADLYLAGMLGRGPEGYGGVADQTRRTLENIAATLRAADLGFEDVQEVYVILTDIRQFEAMDDVYRQVMGDATPVRTVIGNGLMSPTARVEIMMTARE